VGVVDGFSLGVRFLLLVSLRALVEWVGERCTLL
jgi:hypothetical protein